MPLTEQEKNNLVKDGKFTLEQVNYYERTGISYDKIKELQSVLLDSARMENVDSSLDRINEEVDDLIHATFDFEFRRSRERLTMDELIGEAINDIRDLRPNNTENVSESSESVDSEFVGGRKRRKRKIRKSKRKKSKRLGKRSRKTRKYIKV